MVLAKERCNSNLMDEIEPHFDRYRQGIQVEVK